MKEYASTLKGRIRQGRLRKEDVIRHLAELAFAMPNDCVRLVTEEAPELDGLDLSLLSEVRRSDKGGVEVRLIDRGKVLEQLIRVMETQTGDGMGALLRALGTEAEEP